MLTDEEVKESYYKYQIPVSAVRINKKLLLINKAIANFGKDYEYWNKMSVRNLSGMLKSNK